MLYFYVKANQLKCGPTLAEGEFHVVCSIHESKI